MSCVTDVEEIIQGFEKKYGKEDVYTKDFRIKFQKWLNNFKNDVEKNAFLELMKHYEYFNKKWIKEAFTELYKQCLNQGITVDDSRILCMSKENEIDSSIEYIGLLRELDRSKGFGFYNDTIIKNIKVIEGKEDVENVLFFDDISGSGGTVKKYLKNNKKYLEGKNVFVNVCIITSEALKNLNEYCEKEKDFNIKINYYKLRRKSIDDDNVISEGEKMSVIRIEESLWGKGSDKILGYKDSQLLLTFFHNTPNNTISSFWFSNRFCKQGYANTYGEKRWNELFERYRPPKRKIQNMLKKKGD